MANQLLLLQLSKLMDSHIISMMQSKERLNDSPDNEIEEHWLSVAQMQQPKYIHSL